MGNFYTNVTLRTTERRSVVAHMRASGHACFVSPASRGFTTVYDRLSEAQDVRDLEKLATDLSSRFQCAALAVLNHDDDILWIGLAKAGQWVTCYSSNHPLSGSAWKLAQEFGALGLLPLVWLLMRWPVVVFELWRHKALAGILGFPDFTVGFGYDYLSKGERPAGASADDFESV